MAPGLHRMALPLGHPRRRDRERLPARRRRRARHARRLRDRRRDHPRRRPRPGRHRGPRGGAARLRQRVRADRAARGHPRPHRPLRAGRRGGAPQRRRAVDAPAHRAGPGQVRRPRRGRRPARADAGRPRPLRPGADRDLARAVRLDPGDALHRQARHAARRRGAAHRRRPDVGGRAHPGPLARPHLPVERRGAAAVLGRPPPAVRVAAGDLRARLRDRPDGLLPRVAGPGRDARPGARPARPRAAVPRTAPAEPLPSRGTSCGG